MRYKLLALVLLSAVILSACSSTASTQTIQAPAKGEDGYTNISVQDLQSMLQNKDFVMVNVHIPYQGNIPNTDLSIPYNEIEQQVDKLPADKNAKIVLYCNSGNMSTTAAKALVKMGYTNVYELDGGFSAWKQAGLPFEQ